MAEAVPTPGRTVAGWRRVSAIVLLVVGGILLPVSVVSVWLRNQLLDSARYVDTVAPLAQNHDVQVAAATRITNALMSSADVEDRARAALPDRAKFLAAPLATGVRSFVQTGAEHFLASQQFDTLWKQANRLAHDQFSGLLTGSSRSVKIVGDKVQLDLQPVLLDVRNALIASGLTVLEKVDLSKVDLKFDVLESKDLERAQRGTRVLNTTAIALPLLAIACLVAGVLLAADRRRMLMWVGLVIALSAAMLSVAIALGRSRYLDSVSAFVISPAAAAAVYDALVHNVRLADRIIITLGLVLSLGAVAAGPAPWAVRTRALFQGGALRAAGAAGVEPGPIPRWFARHLAFARAVPVLGAIVTLALWDQPRPRTVLVLMVLVVALWLVVETLARIGTAPAAPPEPPLVGE